MEIIEIILLIIAAFITSAISSVLGMGGGIILLGIMAIIIPEGYMVIALHGIIQLVSNSTRTFVFRKHLIKHLITKYIIGAIIGVSLSIIIIILLINNYNVKTADQIDLEILKPLIGLATIALCLLKKLLISERFSLIKVGGIYFIKLMENSFSDMFLTAKG